MSESNKYWYKGDDDEGEDVTKRLALADRYATLLQSPLNGVGPISNRIVIIGAGETRHDSEACDLLEDPDWCVYALNAVAPFDRRGRLRCDCWFDLHQRVSQSADDLRWIALCPVPIYVTDDLLDVGPNALRYPIEDVEAQLGSYWACTFAYQVALALFNGARELALYGVDLHLGNERERTVEWACVNWWLGFAAARGVTIRLPCNTRLGRHVFRYGLEYMDEKDEVEQYERAVHLGDLSRAYNGLRQEYIDHLSPAEKSFYEDGKELVEPVGIGG